MGQRESVIGINRQRQESGPTGSSKGESTGRGATHFFDMGVFAENKLIAKGKT